MGVPCTPPRFNIDIQNDAIFEKEIPFKGTHPFGYLYQISRSFFNCLRGELVQRSGVN